jgi:uncharacterized protein (TIGR00297 family)
LVFTILFCTPTSMTLILGLAAIGSGLAVTWSATRLRVLTPTAASIAGAFAASLIAWGGWAWALPGAVFFLGSSLVSRVGARRKSHRAHRVEKSGPRDAWQVLANGGVAWVCLLLSALAPASLNAVLYAAGLGAFATAAADTWATELGTLSDAPPRSLRTGRRVPPGTSGAVSVHGTLGAALGATTVALSAWAGGGTARLPVDAPALMLCTVGSGCLGMLTDGLLGATLQARYHDPTTGELTERPPAPEASPARGWPGLHNDAVNLLGTATGAGLAALFVLAVG